MKTKSLRVTLASLGLGLAIGSTAYAVVDNRVGSSADTNRAKPVYPTNESGKTFGSVMNVLDIDAPDLIQAVAADGTEGYVRKEEFINTPAANPTEAVKQSQMKQQDRMINLYDRSGKVAIGKFRIASSAGINPAELNTAPK